MRGSLGEEIGEGGTADVHAWAPGQVLKLFKAGVPRRVASWEARMTRAVFAAGFPAPEVIAEVTLERRLGIVPPRLDGPALPALSRPGAMTSEQVGSILATLAICVHKTPPPAEVLSLRDWMDGTSRLRRHSGMTPVGGRGRRGPLAASASASTPRTPFTRLPAALGGGGDAA